MEFPLQDVLATPRAAVQQLLVVGVVLLIAGMGAATLIGLISGVLDLNRIERGQVTYDLVTIPIEPFLADLDALVSPQAAAKRLTLEYVRGAPDLAVIADREKLRQVVLNLLSNAIRYTPSGGRVILSSSAIGEAQVAVNVCDTGPGIPEARQAQVFDPFV